MALEQDYLAKANEALARKDTPEALLWAGKCLAVQPGHVDAAIIAASAMESDKLGDAIANLRQAERANAEPAAKVRLISELVVYVERAERIARGLPPYHVLDMREFPFHFCDAEIAALRENWTKIPPGESAYLSLGPVVHLILGELPAADGILLQVAAASPKKRAPKSYATVRYAPDFYEQLKHVAFTGLPQVQVAKGARFATPHVLYVGCDLAYFRLFALPLLRSLAARSPGADAHLHLMLVAGQPEPQIPNLNLNLRVTYEVIHKGLDSPMYYHAARLVRLHQFLEDRTLWMVDADALVVGDLASLHDKLRGSIGIRVRPGRTQPWNQFSAALVAATPEAKDYFRLVAAYLAHFMYQGIFTWGMDQMALFGVYQHLVHKPTLSLWGPDEFEVSDYRDSASLWFTAGQHKKEYAAGASRPPPDQAKFWDLFRMYAS
jgi:hypothetical protein